MNSIKRLRQRRDLDLFFFHGIPEIPEHMYGFGFQAFDTSRTTRKGIIDTMRNSEAASTDEQIYIWQYNTESRLFELLEAKKQ